MVKFRALFVANLRLQSGSNTLNFSVQQHYPYLQKRYVSSSKYNKLKLIQLATFAQELKLQTLDMDDYHDYNPLPLNSVSGKWILLKSLAQV